MTDYFEELYDIVLDFFDGDEDRVRLWFNTSNPTIGGMTPLEMMAVRPKKCYEIFYQNSQKNLFKP